MNPKNFVVVALISLCTLFCFSADLPRSTPEAQGISSAVINEFIQTADKQIVSMHSFMLVRHGHVVAEGWWTPYSAETPHVLYSLSKSFTSTAVGLAISEGKLSVDDEVLKFFPEDAPPEPSKNLKSMRLRDLLCMSTGHDIELKFPDMKTTLPWTKVFLEHPVPFKPGTRFLYNTPGTYMQSAIVQKVTGQTLLEYLRPRIFEPLGIANPTWWSSPQGINVGGWGLNIRTEDIAKFGQLYLQKGQWNGKQLIPANWVAAATARQTSNGSDPKSDWDQGYGYQFWRCQHGAYRGDGAQGQYCIVMPEQDAVIAITSSIKNMQIPLDMIWEKLLPAMQPSALPENKEAHSQLQKTLAALTLAKPEGSATPPSASPLIGKEFHLPDNKDKLESIKLEVDPKDNTTTLVLRVTGVAYRVVCGQGTWQKGRMAYGSFAEQPVAANGAWSTDGTYTVRLSFYEQAAFTRVAYVTVSLKLAGDELLYDAEFYPDGGKQPQLKGQAK